MRFYWTLAGVLAAALSFGAAQAADPAFDGVAIDAKIVEQTNAYRQQHDAQELRVDAALQKAAQGFADYYAANPGRRIFWGHEYGGSDPLSRAQAAGFEGRCVGENLGWQGTTGSLASLGALDEKFMQGWIESRSHRRNLQTKKFDVIGVGSAVFRKDDMLWVVSVQMFGCSEPAIKKKGGGLSFGFGGSNN